MLIDLETHGVFDNGLTSRSIVVDLGGNAGTFAAGVRRRFGCRVISVEPTQKLWEQIREIDGVTAVHAAVAGENGTAIFNVAENPEASTIMPNSTEPTIAQVQVRTLTLPTLLAEQKLDHVDLLKMDIEGSEIAVFASTPDEVLKKISQISIEFHDFCGLITPQQADEVEHRLARLGFSRIGLSRVNRADTLFYQPKACGVGSVQGFFAKYVSKYLIGYKRVRARPPLPKTPAKSFG